MIVPYWNSAGNYLGDFPAYYPGFIAAATLMNDRDDDFLKFPEETQLELIRHGGDSPEELHRELDELGKKE